MSLEGTAQGGLTTLGKREGTSTLLTFLFRLAGDKYIHSLVCHSKKISWSSNIIEKHDIKNEREAEPTRNDNSNKHQRS